MASRALEVAVTSTLDVVALRALAVELASLDATPGLRSSAASLGAVRAAFSPGAPSSVEVAVDGGVGRRSRAAHARLSALPAEHRPVARWLAERAPLGDGAAAWPLALARDLGPPDVARVERAARADADAAKGRLNALRASARRALTHDVAAALDRAKEEHERAKARRDAAVAELTLWGRDRLRDALAAWARTPGAPPGPRGA